MHRLSVNISICYGRISMTPVKNRTIKVSSETHAMLILRKLCPEEHFDSVIRRLLNDTR
jgi:hypothetical protein